MNPIIALLEDLLTMGFEKFGIYYSQYRGFVKSNDDPNNLSRLQINVPELHGDNTPDIWAWPADNYSGPGYGSQVIPRENDMVWVRFEKGNPRKPIWSFGYFANNEKPEELIGKNLYWFRTPKGLTIKIDDDAKTITTYDKEKETIYSAVLAEILEDKIETLVEIIKTMKINTAIGPQSILPFYAEQLDNLIDDLGEIKSTTNKLN